MRQPIAKVVVLVVVVVLLAAPAARASNLTPIALYLEGQNGIEGLDEAVAGALSPDGADLYTGAQTAAVAHFRRNPATGLLQFVEALRNGEAGVRGLRGIQGITVSPDGLNVYTASIVSNAISVFRRNPATGRLSFVEAEEELGSDFLSQPERVAVSPDGAFVYVTIFQGSVAVYRRDPATGALSFVSRHGDDQGSFDFLVGAEGIAISADGAFVYVAGSVDDTVVVFRRSASGGTLSLIQTVFDDVAGGEALEGVDALTLSPDGRQLYVGTLQDPAITVFDRNPVSGRLTRSAVHSNGIGGVSGLWGVKSLAVSPNGAFLYAASIFDNRLAVFQRDPGTGALTFLDAALPGASSLASDADGKHLYGVNFSAVRAYRTSGASGCVPGPEALCLRNGRFRVEAFWEDGQGGSGPGQAVPLTDETGYFWFFDRDNVEVIAKLLDACDSFGRFWFFAAGLTNVGVEITVTDLATGDVRTYTNPRGRPFPPLQDTGAFTGCP